MISTTASTATKPPPAPVTGRRIKIPLPPAPPTTPRLGVPSLLPSSSFSSTTSSATSSARHSPSPSLSSLPSLSSYATASSLSPTASARSLRYRGSSSSSCRHTAPASPKCAELAGGTAAECAVVFCCCPCGLVNLLYLAVLKLPAGLCRKAIRKSRRRMLAKKRSAANPTFLRDEDDDGLLVLGRTAVLSGSASPSVLWPVETTEMSDEMWEMEKQMWDLFYGTGFWRSPSQREVEVI